jgi:hypothetical protein
MSHWYLAPELLFSLVSLFFAGTQIQYLYQLHSSDWKILPIVWVVNQDHLVFRFCHVSS